MEMVTSLKSDFSDEPTNAHPDNFFRDRSVFINSINDDMSSLAHPDNDFYLYMEDMSSLVLPDNTLSLYIQDIPPISEIPSTWRLKQLKTICIAGCPNLKYIFSIGWLQELQNLEKISIMSCGLEEMIVETEDTGESSQNNDNTITLPSLILLELNNLQKLKSISNRIFICNSLEKIMVDTCPKLQKLPLSINSLPHSLRRIVGNNKWWNSLEWDNSDTQSHLQRFFSSAKDTWPVGPDEDDDDDHGHGADVAANEWWNSSAWDNYDAYSDEDDDDDHGADVAADGEEEKRGTKRNADELI